MADIKTITLPDNTTYNIKDASALATLSISNNILTGTTRGGAQVKVTLPTDKDEKVKQSSSTTNQFIPILGAYATTPTSGNSGQAYYNQNIAINTATNTIKVNACQMTYDAAEDCMKFTFNN